jgi:hypothetical protein
MHLKKWLMCFAAILNACKSTEKPDRSDDTRPVLTPIKECRIIRTENLNDSYLYCVTNDGGALEQRIWLRDIPVIPVTTQDVFVCLVLNDRVKIEKYDRDLNSWMSAH